MILSIMLTTNRIFCSEKMKSEKKPINDLENQSNSTLTITPYNDEFIEYILANANKEISIAFDEGYKKAAVDFKPELDYYKSLYKNQKKDKIRYIVTSSLVCTAIGITGGLIIGYAVFD